MYSLRNYIDIVEGNSINEAPSAQGTAAGYAPAAATAANPYTGPDAEKFARLSPEDQAWYTKGGGKPDLNDPIIASRAPNKGKLGPAPAAAAPAAAPGGAPTSTSSYTGQAATPSPAAGAAAGAAAGGAAAGGAAATPAATGGTLAGMGTGAAGAAVGGATPAAAAQPASGAVAAFGQNAGTPPAAGGANPATGVNAQGQNVTMPDGTNPETGEKTAATPAPAQAATPAPAAAANRDAMPFGQAFADARAKGEKEFTWKGKKYAVAMAKPAAKPAQAATPAPAAAPAQQPGMWDKFKNWATGGGNPGQTASGGQISNTPAAESVQVNEFDMDMDRIMKNMGNMGASIKANSFKSNIDGKEDDTEAGFNTAMNKFSDMAKNMNLPTGAKIDPSNIQSSVDSIKKGIMGQFNNMPKTDPGNSNPSAPGANIPNPTNTDAQDPKDLLKKMPEADIQKLSGDDAKVLLAQLKKLAGM